MQEFFNGRERPQMLPSYGQVEKPVLGAMPPAAALPIRPVPGHPGLIAERPVVQPGIAEAALGGTAIGRPGESLETEVQTAELADEPQQPYDRPLIREPRVNVIGSDKESIDIVATQLVRSRIEALNQTPQPPENKAVVFARFSSGRPWQLVDDRYRVVNADLPALLGTLSNDQKAEVMANAVGGEDSKTVLASRDIVKRIADALECQWGRPPKPDELRDGVRIIAGARVDPEEGINEAPSLDAAGRRAARAALDKPSLEAAQQPLHHLRQWLNMAFPEVSQTAHASMPGEAAPIRQTAVNAETAITVVNVGVDGYGHRLAASREMLSGALLATVAANTPWGTPELVVIDGANDAPAASLRELSDLCASQGIPMVLTANKLNEQTASFVGEGAYAILPVDAPTAKALSDILPPTLRREVTSTSANISVNDGTSVHEGASLNYKTASPGFAESAGTSVSADRSSGSSRSHTENVSYTPGACLLPYEISDIGNAGEGRLVVLGSGGELLGSFDLETRERLGDFPPRKEKPLDVRPEINATQDTRSSNPALASQRAQPGPETPEDGRLPAQPAVPNQLTRRPLLPYQEKIRLQQMYFEETGRSLNGVVGFFVHMTAWRSWLKEVYEREGASESFETWCKRHGV